MLALATIDAVSKSLRRASSLTEGIFFDIGRRLEAAIAVLDRLRDSFAALTRDLDSPAFHDATDALKTALSDLSTLANAPRRKLAVLDDLNKLTTSIGQRIGQIRHAIKTVSTLSINARIAAAAIGAAGAEFIDFSDEIRRSLKVAEVNLDKFSRELAGVRQLLSSACAGENRFEGRRSEDLRTIPNRLAGSIDLISARRARAATAASLVDQSSEKIKARIGRAVMSLQIGDMTRQRIEHAVQAFDFLHRALSADASAPGEPRKLVAMCCKLQAMQIADTLQEFRQEVDGITSSLRELAADARQIRSLGLDAFGASGTAQGTFLRELENDVRATQMLLDEVDQQQAAADHVTISVSDSTVALLDHMQTVESVEADIRLMGLNTSLKCDRLGSQGRILSVIAQELRVYAGHTATEAEAAKAEIGRLVARSEGLRDNAGAAAGIDIAGVGAALLSSIEQLGGVDKNLAGAFATLERDGSAAAALLEETVARIAVHEEIGDVLHAAATSLFDATDAGDLDLPDESSAVDSLFAQIADTYTMDRERQVHGACRGAPPPTPLAATAAALDDVFF